MLDLREFENLFSCLVFSFYWLNLFTLKELNPKTLGFLIATWEHRTYVTAKMLQINPFDQFGVSAGKIFAKKYLNEHGG